MNAPVACEAVAVVVRYRVPDFELVISHRVGQNQARPFVLTAAHTPASVKRILMPVVVALLVLA